MILKNLRIEFMEYGPDKGRYVGKAEFAGERGAVALNLNARHCERIFEVCADGIMATAKEAASDLTCAVIEHQKTLSSTSTTGDSK